MSGHSTVLPAGQPCWAFPCVKCGDQSEKTKELTFSNSLRKRKKPHVEQQNNFFSSEFCHLLVARKS